MTTDEEHYRLLFRFMLLSLAAAVITIVLKALAAGITGSVGFLSDAMESGVNLVAAIVALASLRAAARPPDHNHHFGHGNAEYLSAAVEGGMIFVAAAAIIWTSIQRLIEPIPLTQPGVGLALSTGASLVNLAVGLLLIKVGRRHRSMTLVADGKHLLTDVLTSVGVLVGIALVAILGWEILDPIVALLVGLNILYTGYGLLRRSIVGLLNAALPAEDMAHVDTVLARFRAEESVEFRPVRTWESGRRRFLYVEILVPEDWTVKQGHDLADRLETDIADVLPGATAFTHVEPRHAVH
jgi:cation diffusion facilitator family transporter